MRSYTAESTRECLEIVAARPRRRVATPTIQRFARRFIRGDSNVVSEHVNVCFVSSLCTSTCFLAILPDIAPSDFHLFRSPQYLLCDNKFENLDDTENAIFRYFAQKPIDSYRSGVEHFHTRWQRVVDNKGDYIIH